MSRAGDMVSGAGGWFSIGHSNRSAQQLIGLLLHHRIDRVVDIRAYPRSRRHPHFNQGPLAGALEASGIGYQWRGAALGGMRSAPVDESHPALKEAALRGFAAHMNSPEFRHTIAELQASTASRRLCLLCAEADPGHCHRRLVADYLAANGITLRHIVGRESPTAHSLSPLARRAGDALVYDRQTQGRLGL